MSAIQFTDDAKDTAADHLRMLEGFILTVFPIDGASFPARLERVLVGEDGQYKLELRLWDESTQSVDGVGPQVLDVFDDILSVEVH